ncbi:MAG: alpha-D-ribose 1-methylphosphonate 5-phosphate C-P-lyase PhnJ [Eubacteriales bacterium]
MPSRPGYQCPCSRELPIGRGWHRRNSADHVLIGPDDILKVIDQGNDDSVNAEHQRLISATTGVKTTTDAAE